MTKHKNLNLLIKNRIKKLRKELKKRKKEVQRGQNTEYSNYREKYIKKGRGTN